MLKLSIIIISLAILSFNKGYCDSIPKIEYLSKTNTIIVTQNGYTSIIPKSIFSKDENITLIKKLWNQDPGYIESKRKFYSKLNINTIIVGINYFWISDINKFYPDQNPIDNLYFVSTDYVLVNNNSGSIDVFADLSLSSSDNILGLNSLKIFGETGFSDLTCRLSLELILELLSTSDWDLNQIRIVKLEGYDKFFILYKNEIYAPEKNGFFSFVDHFEDVEKKQLSEFRKGFKPDEYRDMLSE